METHAIVYTQTYKQFKTELDYELNKAAAGFVRIGYLLKQARDTEILKDSPYSSVNEFAEKEYGLDSSQVSRFININEKFAKADDPEELKDEYKGYGVAKLGMMLTLPDSINAELSPELSKTEINTIKKEYEEEQKITPVEVMLETPEVSTEGMELLDQLLFGLGKNEPEVMARLLQEEGFTLTPSPRKEMNILAPAGQKLYNVRLSGKGKFLINIKDGSGTATDMRTGEKITFSAKDISVSLANLIDKAMENTENDIADGDEMLKLLYGADLLNAETAPVQGKVSPSKPQSRITPSTDTDRGNNKSGNHAKNEPSKAVKPQNATIERVLENDAEVLPPGSVKGEDDSQKAADEVLEGQLEVSGDPENYEISEAKIDKNTLRGYKAGLTADIHTLERMNRDNQYRAMRTKMQGMLNILNRIIDQEG